MKKALIYGGGNIGRGFIGQLFFQSGYQTKFIDIDEGVIDEFNTRGAYEISLASSKGIESITIEHVSAVNGKDLDAVAEAISEADIMAVSVGVHVLPHIASTLRKGILRRWERKDAPALNILICENLMNASEHIRRLVEEGLSEGERTKLADTIGFVDTTIGRMVPSAIREAGNSLLDITVEPFCELPVDREAFVGEVPEIFGMKASAPFIVQTLKKLYIHNMGHAVCAYQGQRYGDDMLCQAIERKVIQDKVRAAMNASAQAISKAYDVPIGYLTDHVEDLISRFHNPYTKDTVARVGKDPIRKLKKTDRLTGAALLCDEMGVDSSPIIQGIASALFFQDKSDKEWCDKKQVLENAGSTMERVKVISELMMIEENSRMANVVADTYEIMATKVNQEIVGGAV